MFEKAKIKKISIEKFRNYKDVEISLGENITVISGHNGCGKSTLLALLSSTAGTSIYQPQFDDFFKINIEEEFTNYKLSVDYKIDDYSLKKRLSFNDYSKHRRGIRVIPRADKSENDKRTKSEISKEIQNKFNIGESARIPIPSFYISISRLFPYGETDFKVDKASFNILKDSDIPNELFLFKSEEDLYKKYIMLYNSVFNDTIDENKNTIYSVKKISNKQSFYFMDIKNIFLEGQSIGQDSLMHIVSILFELYYIKYINNYNGALYCIDEINYNGALLCIDEIDVSLHPDAQIRLMDLLKEVSEELNLQIIVTTHSLTIIEKICKFQKDDSDKYKLVYLREKDSPYPTNHGYNFIKNDLYSDFTNTAKLNIYFEDENGEFLYKLLVKTAKQIELIDSTFDKNLEYIKAKLGCDTLLNLNAQDDYFKSVLIILDGDARNKSFKAAKNLYKYLEEPVKGINDRIVNFNVLFLPNYFSPEFYMYRIIYDYYKNYDNNLSFWRNLDNDEKTCKYGKDYIRDNILKYNDKEFKNDDIKKVAGELKEFFETTNILYDYYNTDNNYRKNELNEFINKLNKTITKLKNKSFLD